MGTVLVCITVATIWAIAVAYAWSRERRIRREHEAMLAKLMCTRPGLGAAGQGGWRPRARYLK